jgi:hypothetical protein
MKIQIENLKSQMQGRDLNIYQKADALIEFNKLLDYVEELEQLTIPAVVGRSEQLVCELCGGTNMLDIGDGGHGCDGCGHYQYTN